MLSLTVIVTMVGCGDAVGCYSCVSSNQDRADDSCLEDSFDEDQVALLADCDCCRVRACNYITHRVARKNRSIRALLRSKNRTVSETIIASIISVKGGHVEHLNTHCLTRPHFRAIILSRLCATRYMKIVMNNKL